MDEVFVLPREVYICRQLEADAPVMNDGSA